MISFIDGTGTWSWGSIAALVKDSGGSRAGRGLWVFCGYFQVLVCEGGKGQKLEMRVFCRYLSVSTAIL